MLSVTLLSVFLSHFFDDFSAGTARPQRAANFYKRFHENLLFFLSLSPSLPSLLQKTRRHLCKGHGRGRISISTRHEHPLPRSLITRANPIRLHPTSRPIGPRGRKKKSKLWRFAHPMVTRMWRPCSPACVPCDDITASGFDLCSHFGDTDAKKKHKAHSHLLLINAGGLCTYVHRKSLNN